MNLIQRLKSSVMNEGLSVSGRMLSILLLFYGSDMRYRVDTCQWVPLSDFDINSNNNGRGFCCQPSMRLVGFVNDRANLFSDVGNIVFAQIQLEDEFFRKR